jgi:predicted transcriptional regulator
MRIDQISWQPVVSCEPNTRVSEVYKLLKAQSCDGVLLVSSGRPVGYFTWNDLSAPLLQANSAWGQIAVGSYGHGSTFQATPGMDIERVLRQMRRHDLPIVAVTQNGAVLGIVSREQLSAES